MSYDLRILENDFWQVGILPETGASTAFGRVKIGGAWVDVMRPTAEADYSNSSNCASFLMIPWSNRVRDARFRFKGVDYPLQVSSKDGTAIHGDVRKRPWQVVSADRTHIKLSFESAAHENVNFPFKFSARAEYALEDRDFVMRLMLKNADQQPMPAGFGHHPYFVKPQAVTLELPYDRQFELVNSLPSGPSIPIMPRVDFRKPRPLADTIMDDQLTSRQGEKPSRLIYPDVEVSMHSDPIFQHVVVFSPPGKPFYAIEPVTNANDGFNLYDQGVANTGVFVLEPGEEKGGNMRLRIEKRNK
jgi:aldose 1-epimerase